MSTKGTGALHDKDNFIHFLIHVNNNLTNSVKIWLQRDHDWCHKSSRGFYTLIKVVEKELHPMYLVDKNHLNETILDFWSKTFPEAVIFECCFGWESEIILKKFQGVIINLIIQVASFVASSWKPFKIVIKTILKVLD